MLEIKQLPKSEIEITGEMPAEEFSKFWGKAVSELSKNAKLPGFRPGKIPEKILIEKISEGAVLDKAAELALNDVYPRIVSEKKINIIGQPGATITKIARNASLGFKFQAVILPEIQLSENYKKIALEVFQKKEETTVSNKEVDDSIEYLRKMRKGKDAVELPELNDEFAKSVGKFETMGQLKETIKKNITAEKKFENAEKKRIEAMEAILKESPVEMPDILVEGEKNRMLSETKNRVASTGLEWKDYLKHVKKKDLSAEDLAKAEEEILSGWTEDAVKRVKFGLLLERLSKEMKIEVSDEEIEKKTGEFGGRIDKEKDKSYIYGIIRNEKIFSVLSGLETC